MKESMGGVTIINIIVIFMLIIFGLLAATFSYTKAYKVNTRIMNGIEIFEGYNEKSLTYINNFLGSIGYQKGSMDDCSSTLTVDGKIGVLDSRGSEQYHYCVYYFDEQQAGNCYYSYAVITYVGFDLPLIRRFNVPINSKTNRIFNFSKEAYSQCSRN